MTPASFPGAARCRLVFRDPLFDFGDACERIVPARLQFPGHEPVGWVGGVVLAEGSVGSVTRCLKITRKSIADLIAPVCDFSLSRNSCSDRSRFNDLKDSRFNRIIDAESAESNAARFAVIESSSVTGITWDRVLHTRIAQHQLAAAAATANEPG